VSEENTETRPAAAAEAVKTAPAPETAGKKPLYMRPEIIAACIGALGAASVPILEHFLGEEKAEQTTPPGPTAGAGAPSNAESQQQQAPQTVPETTLRPVSLETRPPSETEPPAEIARDDDSGLVTIKGVLVQPHEETRIVETGEAYVYPEPSTLRAPHIRRLQLGDQVTLYGKVADAPWYVVRSGDEYGFVRTKHFSTETIGGE